MSSVVEAALRLGVHPGRVHQLVAEGDLQANKVGGRRLLAEDAVEDRRRVEGLVRRALSLRSAGGLFMAAAGVSVPWLAPVERRCAEQRAAGSPLSQWASARRHRAVRFDRYVHPSVLARLADDARLVGSGVSARSLGVDVLALDQVEGYVSTDAWPGLVADYGVLEAARSNFRFRVPPAGLFVFGDSGEAPWPVVVVDLFDAGDDRSRCAGHQLVERFA
jgi:excisionase family DNA binding protein